jgi:FtsZ-interacting cell division protein ZipA
MLPSQPVVTTRPPQPLATTQPPQPLATAQPLQSPQPASSFQTQQSPQQPGNITQPPLQAPQLSDNTQPPQRQQPWDTSPPIPFPQTVRPPQSGSERHDYVVVAYTLTVFLPAIRLSTVFIYVYCKLHNFK